MRFTYTVDSKGNAQMNYKDPIHILNETQRISQLNKIVADINAQHISDEELSPLSSFFITEKGRVLEKIVIFNRVPIASTDENVKQAHIARTQSGYKFTSDEQRHLLSSIYSTLDKNKTLWWVLKAEIFTLERNLYDTQYILCDYDCECISEFLEYCDKISQNDLFKFYGMVAFPLRAESALEHSVCYDEEQLSQVHSVISKAIPAENVRTANEQMCSLNEMRNHQYMGNMYEFYNSFKKFLHKEIPDAYLAYYWSNAVGFKIGDNDYSLFVCEYNKDDKTDVFYYIGGNRYTDLEQVKADIKSGVALVRKEWFDNINQFLPQRPQKQKHSRKADIEL